MRIPVFWEYRSGFLLMDKTCKSLTRLRPQSPRKSTQSFVIYLIYRCQYGACNWEQCHIVERMGSLNVECACARPGLCAGWNGFVRLPVSCLQSPVDVLVLPLCCFVRLKGAASHICFKGSLHSCGWWVDDPLFNHCDNYLHWSLEVMPVMSNLLRNTEKTAAKNTK